MQVMQSGAQFGKVVACDQLFDGFAQFSLVAIVIAGQQLGNDRMVLQQPLYASQGYTGRFVIGRGLGLKLEVFGGGVLVLCLTFSRIVLIDRRKAS
jgi:hypothetical protein